MNDEARVLGVVGPALNFDNTAKAAGRATLRPLLPKVRCIENTTDLGSISASVATSTEGSGTTRGSEFLVCSLPI